MDRQNITYRIRFHSEDSLRRWEQIRAALLDLTRTATRTAITFPGGIEKRIVKSYKIGDYFDKIEWLHDGAKSSRSFILTFHLREGTDSNWRNVIVQILSALDALSVESHIVL